MTQTSNLAARRHGRRSAAAWAVVAALVVLGPLLLALPSLARRCPGQPWCPPTGSPGLPAALRQASTPTPPNAATAAPKPSLTPALGAALPAQAPGAPANARPGCTLYAAADLPADIPDNDPGGITSTVHVPLPAVPLTSVGVLIGELRHPYVGDLRLTLAAPDAASLLLVDRVGNDTDDFLQTHFYDDAPLPIASGVGPFTGAYRPDQSLAPLTGVAASGQWALHVSDLTGGDSGSLHSWWLELCAAQPLPPPPASAALGPEGGTLQLSYGLLASVAVPGAAETLTVTLATTGTRALPTGAAPVGTFFHLAATDGAGQALTELSAPAQVVVHYGGTPHRGEVLFGLYAWDNAGSAYAPLATTRDPQADTLTALLPSLTEFGILAQGYESFFPTVRR